SISSNFNQVTRRIGRPYTLKNEPQRRKESFLFIRDADAVANGQNCGKGAGGVVDQAIVFNDAGGRSIGIPFDDSARPQHIVRNKDSTFAKARESLSKAVRILMLIDVHEDNIELAWNLIQTF